jgi:isopentenyl-diphosphate delta-isomerase type 1
VALPENAGDRGQDAAPRQDDRDLLDLVDEAGRVIGTASREECHSHPLIAHRAVHVFVRNPAGAIFLQKRSRTKRIQPGRWDTSVGGHLNAGESYEDGAERELLEELGVSVKDAGGPGALRRLHDYIWRSPVETEHVRTYELVSEGPFTLHPAEIDEGRFWTEDELRAAAGTGALTPNLEEELRRLGVLPG